MLLAICISISPSFSHHLVTFQPRRTVPNAEQVLMNVSRKKTWMHGCMEDAWLMTGEASEQVKACLLQSGLSIGPQPLPVDGAMSMPQGQ